MTPPGVPVVAAGAPTGPCWTGAAVVLDVVEVLVDVDVVDVEVAVIAVVAVSVVVVSSSSGSANVGFASVAVRVALILISLASQIYRTSTTHSIWVVGTSKFGSTVMTSTTVCPALKMSN